MKRSVAVGASLALGVACHEQASVGGLDPLAGSGGGAGQGSALATLERTTVLGGLGDEATWHALADDAGRIYLGGTGRGAIDLGAGPESVSDLGTGFIAAYDADHQLRWVRTFPATERSAVHHLALAGQTLWATGYFAGEMTAGSVTLDGGAAQRMAVWQLDVNGEVQQVRQYGADRNVQGWTVAPSSAGVLLCASYLGNLDLGLGALGEGPLDGDSALAFRLTSDGSAVVWAHGISAEATDPSGSVLCRSALDLQGGRVAVVGTFTGTLAAPWGQAAQGSSAALVAAFDADGGAAWLRVLDSTGGAEANAAAVAGADLVLVGALSGDVLDPGDAPAAWLDDPSARGGQDAFIAVVDGLGALRWARRIGGAGNDGLTELAVDAAGNLWATGSFEQSLTVGGETVTAEGAADAFLIGFTPTGAVLGLAHLGGAGTSGGVAIDARADELLVVGQFEGELRAGATSVDSQGVDTFVQIWRR